MTATASQSHSAALVLLACLGAFCLGCAQAQGSSESSMSLTDTVVNPSADTVITNARIYTVTPETPWARALAIREGRYVYVGDDAGAEAFVGESTQVIDLDGAMLMPGINDIHSHPWQDGIKQLYHCNFPFTASLEEVGAQLRRCVADNPDIDFIEGGQWTSNFFQDNDIESPRAWLDAISDEIPIFLHDDATHNGWVNSAALAMAGIDAQTPDPEGGKILRDARGEPNGLLYESARRTVLDARASWTVDQYRAAIAAAVQQANRFGLTGFNEARVQAAMLEAYGLLDEAGDLTVHVTANLQTPRAYRDTPLDMESFIALRDKYQSPHVNSGYVKIFLDGVPTASRTALLLADYTTDADHPEPTRGFILVDADTLKQDMVAFDAAGFTVKIHAAGDGSVRVALDAIAAARKANGDSGLRHQLAHAGYIDPDDVARFAELNATVDASPYIWFPSPIMDSIVDAMGERGLRYYPVRELMDLKTDIGIGSDWPSAAVSLNPWGAIEALVTRSNPASDGDDQLWPEQAITLDEALYIATMGGARGLDIEQKSGSIEVGKLADFIILDQNLFAVPIQQISDTHVKETWFAGERVYRDVYRDKGGEMAYLNFGVYGLHKQDHVCWMQHPHLLSAGSSASVYVKE